MKYQAQADTALKQPGVVSVPKTVWRRRKELCSCRPIAREGSGLAGRGSCHLFFQMEPGDPAPAEVPVVLIQLILCHLCEHLLFKTFLGACSCRRRKSSYYGLASNWVRGMQSCSSVAATATGAGLEALVSAVTFAAPELGVRRRLSPLTAHLPCQPAGRLAHCVVAEPELGNRSQLSGTAECVAAAAHATLPGRLVDCIMTRNTAVPDQPGHVIPS